MPCGCVTSPRIYASNPAYSKRLGGMGVNGDAASMSTTGGAAAACAIGPKGPMVVRPEGRTDRQLSGLKASPSSGLIVEPSGLKARLLKPEGLTPEGPATAYQRRVVCTAIPVLKVPPNKRAQIEHRIWPVTDSHHALSPNNGHSKPALSSLRLDYISGLGPTATSGHVNQRQRQRRRLHARIADNVLSGLAEKFAETGLLVSSNAKPMFWPGLILSGFVWPACGLSNVWPDPVCGLSDTWPVQLLAGGLILYVSCLVRGLSSHGLIRFCPVLCTACLIPDPVWFGLV